MVLCSVALSLFVGRSFALAASEWLLMSRHGGCAEVQSLKRKFPDLGEICDPSAFAKLMREKGYQVAMNEVLMPKGKAVEVKVPERELFLMFVISEVCQQSGRE
jgi:hypothetical protein